MTPRKQLKKSRKYLKYLNEYGMTQSQRLHRIILRRMGFDNPKPNTGFYISKAAIIEILYNEIGKKIIDREIFLMSSLGELSRETGLYTHYGYGDFIYITRSEE